MPPPDLLSTRVPTQGHEIALGQDASTLSLQEDSILLASVSSLELGRSFSGISLGKPTLKKRSSAKYVSKFPLYVTSFPGHHLTATYTRVRKTLSTRAQSEEPWVEENLRTGGDQVEKGQASGPVSPPRSTKMPWA